MKRTYLKKDNVIVEFKQVGERRTMTTIVNYGCTYKETTTSFNSAEEGNKHYRVYVESGFVKAAKDDYDRVVRGY